MKPTFLLRVGVLALISSTLYAQVPQIVNYQGRVLVGSTNFDGTGQFKFALVNAAGTVTYWSNDGTSVAGSQPTNAVSLTVTKGLYSVLLGDTTIPNMTVAIPLSTFNNADVRLRVWFNNGTIGSQLLTPDQRIVANGYAMMSGTVIDGAITGNKIAAGAITSANIANGAIGTAQIASAAVTSAKIDTTTVQQRVTGTAPAGSFITGINANGTVTSAAGGSGTITGVTAGTGLTGGGTSGTVSLGIASGGVGTTQLANSAVGTAQIANAAVNSTKIDNTTVQQRVTGTAPAGSFITGINANGTVTSAAAPSGIWSLNGTSAFYNGGKVGVGTNAPNEQLEIAASTGGRFIVSDAGGASRRAVLLQGPTASQQYGRVASFNYGTSLGMNLALNDTGGNVGIGTGAPVHQLTIKTAGTTPAWTTNGWAGAIALDQGSAIGWQPNSNGWKQGIGHSDGGLYVFRTGSNLGDPSFPATYDLTVSDFGYVGIGTTTPNSKLTILTPTADYGMEHTDGDVRVATFVGGSTGGGWLGTISNHPLSFFANNSSALMTINTAGKVGIGTTNPASKLHIVSGASDLPPRIESAGANQFAAGLDFYLLGAPKGYIGVPDGSAPFGAGKMMVYGGANTPVSMWANGLEALTIDTARRIGIITNNPQTQLHQYDTGSVSHRIETVGGTNSWARVEFKTINGQWNTGTSQNFNGDQFYINHSSTGGTTFSIQPNGDVYSRGTMSCGVLTIRGGADLAEPFQMKEEVEKGAVVVIDDKNPGRLRRSSHAYDRRVAGIVSGANGVAPGISLHQEGVIEGGQNVALTGRVYVQATSANGPIEPGDLLTTSEIPGTAMKVTDHDRAQGAILGKAMNKLESGDGMVLTLVSLQ